jgi:hypothetical protein
MANACIAYNNLADTAPLILATSSNLLLPVSNIINPHIARKWRGSTPGHDSVIIDLGSLQSFDTIAVLGITGTAITIKASAIDSTGVAGEITSGTYSFDQNYKSQIVALPNPITARYIRFDVTNGTTGLAEIGRVFIGSRVQFKYNFIKGWQRSWNDLSLRSKTRGGQTQIFPDAVYRKYDVSFGFLTQSDRDGFIEDIDRINAMKTDVLFITDPASVNLSRDSVWGLVSAISPVVQPQVGLFTKQYQIEERL